MVVSWYIFWFSVGCVRYGDVLCMWMVLIWCVVMIVSGVLIFFIKYFEIFVVFVLVSF